MKWSIGILVAPRPVPSIGVTIQSLRRSWSEVPYCFVEPQAVKDMGCDWSPQSVPRPSVLSPGCRFQASPEGVFGNFQNWLQAAADLLWVNSRFRFDDRGDSDAIMICEDDAEFTVGIREYVESCLWPSEDCGVVSLYCPPLHHYRSLRGGITRTRLLHSGDTLRSRNNLVGALALIFPRKVLAELVNHPSQESWGGSHEQTRSGVNPWERKAVDTWIGRALLEMGRTAWHFSPSLVNHYAPNNNVSNSSMGNGMNRSARQAKNWSPILRPNQVVKPKQVFAEVK